jgi:hypothetical protein
MTGSIVQPMCKTFQRGSYFLGPIGRRPDDRAPHASSWALSKDLQFNGDRLRPQSADDGL